MKTYRLNIIDKARYDALASTPARKALSFLKSCDIVKLDNLSHAQQKAHITDKILEYIVTEEQAVYLGEIDLLDLLVLTNTAWLNTQHQWHDLVKPDLYVLKPENIRLLSPYIDSETLNDLIQRTDSAKSLYLVCVFNED